LVNLDGSLSRSYGRGFAVITGSSPLSPITEIASRTTILIQLSFLIVLTLLLDWLPIRLSIVPERVKHAHARQLTHREFNAHIAEGPKRNRILLFVSPVSASRAREFRASLQRIADMPDSLADDPVWSEPLSGHFGNFGSEKRGR
jgi:hypothetical protein